MSDEDDRKRRRKHSKHKKEKKSKRDRSHDSPRNSRREESPQYIEVDPVVLPEVLAAEPPVAAVEVPPTTSSAPTPTPFSTTFRPALQANPQPSTSNAGNDGEEDKKKEDEDDRKLDPWIPFECSQCKITAKCFYKELRCSDGFYPSPVFYMRDPFTPPPRVRGRKPVLADYVVVGSTCSICEAPMCLAKSCSLYFGAHFCGTCVQRERRRFPEKLVEQVSRAHAQSSIVKQEPPPIKQEANGDGKKN